MTDASANNGGSMSLADVARLLAERRLPPVEQWSPSRTGDSEMRIARDGRWFHQGSPIGRPAMVRLFSTILRREADGRHVLVTPSEMLDIEVEDVAFVAVAVESEGTGPIRRLAFRLNTDDYVIAGPRNALRFDTREHGEPVPYLHVRFGLEARIARPVYYELAEMIIGDGAAPPGLWSEGSFFAFGDAA